MKNKIYKIIVICVSCIPSIVSADVFITEVMYDKEGADSKKEWIEIYNSGETINDFTKYKLFENDVYHGIKEYVGGIVIPEKTYAIIADSPRDVLGEIPDGTIVFDSAFSLSNSGEVIAIANKDKNILDEVFYDVEIGAKGDGKTLQKEREVWIVGDPNPGSGTQSANIQTIEEEQVENVQEEVTVLSGAISKPIVQDPFTIEIVVPEIILEGEVALFSARAFDSQGDEINFNNYHWNFGDGSTGVGNNIVHTYRRSGKYVVFIDGEYNYHSDSDKTVISVGNVPVEFKVDGKSIGITNLSHKEFNLSHWSIFDSSGYFTFPKNTFLSAKTSIILGEKELGFVASDKVKIMTASGNFWNIKNEQKIPEETEGITDVRFVASSIAFQAPEKPNHNTALINEVVPNKETEQLPWLTLLIVSVLFGLGVLYFLQKRNNLIEKIEIIDS